MEKIFSKKLKNTENTLKKHEESGKIERARQHLKVLVGTLRVPIGTQLNQSPIILFCVFRHFSSLFWFYLSLKKKFVQ